ncbi:hypothetical protein AVEN_151734-1 [Araneus ventricosus]|uniref:Uncharacterized protein n=1 Tax=Araneus ventricosus TaxID=182803 RepID=A0A4Y2DN24_ARAVE|nr:hypothetical protein AVEN_151734-1 [Araneus ventricosus]
MTRTTPELAPPLQASTPHQREDLWPLCMIWYETGPIHGGSSVESGFEPGTLRPQSLALPLGQRGLNTCVDYDMVEYRVFINYCRGFRTS